MGTDQTLQQLHSVEDHLIELGGLLEVLKKICPEEGGTSSLLTAISGRYGQLQTSYYDLWKMLSGEEGHR